MQRLYDFLTALGLALFFALLLSGCASSADVPAALSQPVDSALMRQAQTNAARLAVERLSTGRIKFKGPVVFQLGGTGNTASATAATKAKAPVAAGPAAVATDSSKKGGAPWQVYAVVGALVLGLGVWLGTKLGGFRWLASWWP